MGRRRGRIKEAVERAKASKGGTRYLTAREKWAKAGRPERSDDQVKFILDTHCRPCEHFQSREDADTGWCGLCGCGLNLGKRLNKLRWATEGCPAEPPKWLASVFVEEDLTPEPAQEAEPNPKPKTIRQQKKEAPAIVGRPEFSDPLWLCDSQKQPVGHTLRGHWWPSPAFLVGGGPSISDMDLSPLRERGICSLAINNVAGYAPVSAFISSDPPEKFHHGIWFDPKVIKFVAVRSEAAHQLNKRVRAKKPDGEFAFTTMRVCDCPNVWGFKRDGKWEPTGFFATEAATWGISNPESERLGRPHILFTFFLALRLLHYLGCPRVYLVGVDFGMQPDGAGYAFGQDRTEGARKTNNNSYRLASGMIRELLPTFDQHGFQVFNTNPASHLDAFPLVPFDKAVEDCRGLVPKEPFDLAGFYEKPGQDDDERE